MPPSVSLRSPMRPIFARPANGWRRFCQNCAAPCVDKKGLLNALQWTATNRDVSAAAERDC